MVNLAKARVQHDQFMLLVLLGVEIFEDDVGRYLLIPGRGSISCGVWSSCPGHFDLFCGEKMVISLVLVGRKRSP